MCCMFVGPWKHLPNKSQNQVRTVCVSPTNQDLVNVLGITDVHSDDVVDND